jgi:hypothetical protein
MHGKKAFLVSRIFLAMAVVFGLTVAATQAAQARSFAALYKSAVSSGVSAPQSFQGVLTSRNDLARTGQNLNETVLTPQNVNTSEFGRLLSYTVDGQIYGQPLYVPNVSIPGQGTRNVLYVATQMDSVFAFDADGLQSAPLWQDSFINLAQGIGPVPCWLARVDNEACSVYPYHGINGTPVIDPSTNTMYLVSRTYQASSGKGFQYLHALDITTGAEKFGGPVLIHGSVPGTGSGSHDGVITFSELDDIQRPGLLLLNGVVYIGWSGAEHGWIMGYDAQTLAQTAIFSTTPDAVRGGVWQSGNGLAADTSGDIYATVGDALFDADTGGPDYGDTLLKLDSGLNVVDYFTPLDQNCRYLDNFDLSGSGPVVLPKQPGNFPDEVITAGKGGSPCDLGGAPIYLLNQNSLGKYAFYVLSDDAIQQISGAPHGYWSSPAYWYGQNSHQPAGPGAFIYYAGVTAPGGQGDYLKMYSLTQGLLSRQPVAQSPNIFPIGATPSISANGSGSGVVWAIERQEAFDAQPGQLPAILYSYDAGDVSNMLYNSSQNVQRDQGGCGNKFQVPTIANGKVYVATQNQVDIFGVLSSQPAPAVYFSAPCNTFADQPVNTSSPAWPATLTNSGGAALNIGSITLTGMNASDFSQTNNCPSTLQPTAYCTIQIMFEPSAPGPRIAQLIVNDNALATPQNVAVTGYGVSPTAAQQMIAGQAP